MFLSPASYFFQSCQLCLGSFRAENSRHWWLPYIISFSWLRCCWRLWSFLWFPPRFGPNFSLARNEVSHLSVRILLFFPSSFYFVPRRILVVRHFLRICFWWICTFSITTSCRNLLCKPFPEDRRWKIWEFWNDWYLRRFSNSLRDHFGPGVDLAFPRILFGHNHHLPLHPKITWPPAPRFYSSACSLLHWPFPPLYWQLSFSIRFRNIIFLGSMLLRRHLANAPAQSLF